MKILISLPCFNEEAKLQEVLEKLPKTLKGFKSESIVIDDGSTDATFIIAQKYASHVIKHKGNKGLGTAFASALNFALENHFDILITIDGDGQFPISKMEDLISPILNGDAHMVTASRFLNDQVLPDGIPPMKLWGNKKMSSLISQLSGKNFKDVSCGFRAYSREAMLQLNLHGTFTYTQETFLDLCFKKLTIKEVPVQVQYFKDRKSKMASSLIKYAINTSKIILRTYRDYQPLRFYLFFAAIFFIPALMLSTFFFWHFFTTGKFSGHLWAGFSAAFFFFLSIAFTLLGILADSLKLIRMNQERIIYLQKKASYGDLMKRETSELS
jgi:glycosyltransferase involved in cell wall biosynthesis